MNTNTPKCRIKFWLLLALACIIIPVASIAVTFTNQASIKVDDPNNALTATNGIFTVSCWFRISIPSDLNLSQNMILLMDRVDGNEADNHSYQIRYNYSNGNIEFFSKGSGGTYTKTLILRPYFLNPA